MATAVVITGASRGFGRAAAVAFTAELAAQHERLDLFLWARDKAKLKDTERAVEVAALKLNAHVRTFSTGVDLANQSSYVPQTETLIQQLQSQEAAYETVYVVHNAASVGQLGCTDAWKSASELASYWELNLNSVCFVNARLLASLTRQRLVLVDITSGLATTPTAGGGLYCTGKAAREMHFRVIAEENKSATRVRVVNYSPGPLDTDMMVEIRECTSLPESTHQLFVAYKEDGNLLRAEDSALYCAQVVVGDAYASGSTVRYDGAKLVVREDIFP